MAKKVLILSSSPRRGGNSDTLCDEFMRGAMESGNEVEKIFLRDKIINYCTGCSTCSRYNKPCPQKDDTAEILEKMIRAVVAFRVKLEAIKTSVTRETIPKINRIT